jgi:hypothetical protein
MNNTFNIKRTATNGDGVSLNSVAHPRPTSKIDLIIDALHKVELLFESHGQYPHTLREVNEAIAAARELKAFREVLIGDNYILRFYPSDTGWMCGISNEMMDAIEEVTK